MAEYQHIREHRSFVQTLLDLKNALKQRSPLVDILLLFFGIGSWLGINSTYLQMPLLVEIVPEKWRLPSFVTIVVQLGNIGPLLYIFLQKCSSVNISDANLIYGVKFIGALGMICMAFFYDHTIHIGTNDYSAALLVSVFLLAIVACTSSVLFMPYMGRFKEIYLITYLVGEGISGLIPGIVALFQGIGGPIECVLIDNTTVPPTYEPEKPNPNFSTTEYFIFSSTVMLCSLIAFLLLEKLKICRKEYSSAVRIGYGNTYEYSTEETQNSSSERSLINQKQFKYLLGILVIISFIGNGVLPSIQSFSCMPYGNKIYHLTVTLTSIVNPLSCLLAIILPHSSLRLISVLLFSFFMCSSYIIAAALMSPKPPMISTDFGNILIILIWTTHAMAFSYLKLCITTVMRSRGGNSLVITGATAQFGTVIGSIFAFTLVNFTNLFTSANSC